MGMKTLALAALTALLAAAPAQSPPAATVHIKDFAFVPARLTVDAGAVVRFVNDDGEAHTVTAVDKSFDSEGLDTDAQWTHRFAKPGTYAYFCELHPYMKGTIVVRPSPQS
jgi:plastocyanin